MKDARQVTRPRLSQLKVRVDSSGRLLLPAAEFCQFALDLPDISRTAQLVGQYSIPRSRF